MEYERTEIILNSYHHSSPTWWERRSNLERRAMVIVFLLFLITVALVIGILVIMLEDREDYLPYYVPEDHVSTQPETFVDGRIRKEPLCLAAGCIHAASTVMKYMDTSVNPCNDFYHFACGGFLNETNIPGELASVNTFTLNYEILEDQLRTVVEDEPKKKETKPYLLLRKLYKKCMDTASIDDHGLQTLKQLLRSFGGWPIHDGYDWDEQSFDWKEAIYNLRRTGIPDNFFFTIGVTLDYHNASRYLLEIDEPDLGLEQDFLVKGVDDVNVKAYFAYMVDVASLIGAEMPFALTELKALLEFEVSLAKIAINNKGEIWNFTGGVYNPTRISELQRKYPTIPWLDYINNILGVPDIRVSYEEVVIVRAPEYIANFEYLLKWTSKRVQANYIMWKVMKYAINYLTTELRDRQDVYYKALFKDIERPSRWEECVITVSTRLPYVMASLYTDKFIDDFTKAAIDEMLLNIRHQFIEILRSVDWMDENTRNKAMTRAETMIIYTSYSDEVLSLNRLEKYYSELHISNEDYLSQIVSIDVFEKNKYYRRLRQYAGITDWDPNQYMSALSPSYSPFENILNVPNSVLKGMFYSNDRPQYLNYGGLGYIVAHEIIHGFDDTGIKYDRDGRSFDWWSEQTKRSFLRKAQCINTQHRNYSETDRELFMKGINKHEANIASQGGLKAAYFAYVSWADRYGQEFQLPTLRHLTPQQVFWIAAAQTHCSKYRSEYLKSEGFAGQQSPAYFDVHETFSNVEYFALDFGCPFGTQMNPENKCYVW